MGRVSLTHGPKLKDHPGPSKQQLDSWLKDNVILSSVLAVGLILMAVTAAFDTSGNSAKNASTQSAARGGAEITGSIPAGPFLPVMDKR